MNDSLASLRHKITGASELKSVVRSMKALAASSIGQFERSVLALADYDRTVQLALSICLRNRLVRPRQTPPHSETPSSASVIVFGSDQGLVGQFNDSLAETVMASLDPRPANLSVWAVGERVASRLADHGLTLEGVFSVPNSVNAITPLIGELLLKIVSRSSAEVGWSLYIYHNQPRSRVAYEPVRQRLLPLDAAWVGRLAELEWPTKQIPEILGDTEESFQALIREYLFVSLFKATAESLAAENASRLVAMQRAEKNIDELVERLTLHYQRLRQNSIDEELFDVVSGYESLTHNPGDA